MTQLPKFHETFIPILEILKDGRAIHYNELKKRVRDTYYGDLNPEAAARTTRDGQPIILNRIGWAKSYLTSAGYVTIPERALVQITPKGLEALKKGSLTFAELKQQPEFVARENAKRQQNKEIIDTAQDATPQDMIDAGIQSIEDEAKAELLERLKKVDPYAFEKIVNDLFEKMGYGGAETTVKSGDGGIDGVINQDELGLEKIYVQAKRYDGHSVREPEIRNFIGAMSGDTQKGIFVTTSEFDQKAVQKARDAHHTIILIDGKRLTDLMYKYSVGLQTANTYVVKEIDEDYFV